MFFNSADPDFCATDEKNIELWRGEEFDVDDKPPDNSIATKYNILDAFRKSERRGYVDFDWVSTNDASQISEKQSIDLVLEGAIDRFNEFGLQCKRKARYRRIKMMTYKRQIEYDCCVCVCVCVLRSYMFECVSVTYLNDDGPRPK